MGLIPRTYRWDKYQFRKTSTLESVPKVEQPRQVEAGKKIHHPLEQEEGSQNKPGSRDRYFNDSPLPKAWAENYHERRTLWKPRQSPSLIHDPSQVLLLTSPGVEFPEPPIIKTLIKHYDCDLKKIALAKDESNPLDTALRQVAKEEFDLLVLDRSNFDWSGALLKEVTQPVLILPTQAETTDFPKKVLVPVDGTPFSYLSLSQAIILGDAFGTEIQVLEVTEEKDQALSDLVEKMDWKKLHHGFFQTKGDIPQAIAEFANNEAAQLIIMGTHSVSPGTTHFPPSVTLEVLRRSPLPLLVVHPED